VSLLETFDLSEESLAPRALVFRPKLHWLDHNWPAFLGLGRLEVLHIDALGIELVLLLLRLLAQAVDLAPLFAIAHRSPRSDQGGSRVSQGRLLGILGFVVRQPLGLARQRVLLGLLLRGLLRHLLGIRSRMCLGDLL